MTTPSLDPWAGLPRWAATARYLLSAMVLTLLAVGTAILARFYL